MIKAYFLLQYLMQLPENFLKLLKKVFIYLRLRAQAGMGRAVEEGTEGVGEGDSPLSRELRS